MANITNFLSSYSTKYK